MMLRRMTTEGIEGLSAAAPEDERPAVRRRHDIDDAVFIDISRGELRADARFIVNQLGNELRAARRAWIPNSAEPIKHCVAIRIGIDPALLVRKQPLPCHEVRNAIAVD